jgi:NADPH-dependent 2,4-dienoyl-CoA reductase/sulfur reductase-like enzyme
VDAEGHQIETSKGKTLEYDKLVLATGSRLVAPLEGADLPGVYNFKSLGAAETLIGQVKRGQAHSAVVVGAGFIGVEIALLLRELGIQVTQVEMLDQIMPRMLDTETAAYVLRELQRRGVEVRLNRKATAFKGQGHAAALALEDGEMLQADLFIAATGVRPNLGFLEDSGLEAAWGVSVNAFLQTSHSDVYAAGDVVEAPDRLTGETYVHAIFPNATAQGRVVGLNLAGHQVRYEGADRMNSLKHLDLPVMAVGLKEGDEILRVKRNGTLRTLYVKDHRLVGFQMVGDIRAAGVLRAMMLRGDDIRPIKDHLLERTFSQGLVAWEAMSLLS